MEGVFRATRDAPPSHLRLKIEYFKTLSSSSLERYESTKFKAGDHHWKLALYPNGNKKSGGKDHISLYLVLVDGAKEEVRVNFSLFLFDHIRDKYFYVQGLSRFHEWQNEYGFDKFLPLAKFKAPSSGYLNNGTCVFGAEVFHIKNEPKGSQILPMPKVTSKPHPFKHTWRIEKFLQSAFHESEIFTGRGHDWRLHVYPTGKGIGKGNSVSLYLQLADSKSLLAVGGNIVVQFKLRIVDQVGSTHKEFEVTVTFNSSTANWGWQKFLSLSELNKGTGYLVNDTCVIEVEIIVLGG